MVNHKRVARLMATAGIAGKGGRRKVRTTVQDPTATPFADLVERDVVPRVRPAVVGGRPNRHRRGLALPHRRLRRLQPDQHQSLSGPSLPP
ncbi:MAG: hypothetical protein M3256_24830 [Actinomycetota bacterium]|nr:hypothetical protein [Actinomycetota bacterium]